MSDIIPWMAPWSGRILALLVAAAGVVIVWRALFRDRSRGRLRCPKCWYDATGLPSTTCPECGHTVKVEADRLRTRRYWRTAMMGVLVALLLPVLVVQRRVRQYGWDYYLTDGPGYWLFPTVLEESHQVAGYEIRIERDRRDVLGPESVRVLKNGEEVFQATGNQWHVGGYVTGTSPGPFAGVDMNGNGFPDLLLQDGAGEILNFPCIFHVLEIAPQSVRLLAKIEGDPFLNHVADLDGDGKIEIVTMRPDISDTGSMFNIVPSVVYSPNDDGIYAPSPNLLKHISDPEADESIKA